MSLRSIIHNLKFNKWNLAFVEESLEGILQSKSVKVNYMKGNNRKQWFADPFILDVTPEHIICLVEELSYKTMRGRIAKLVIDRKTYKLLETKILLDLPTHLSFPFILRKDGNVYVLPENSASGCSTIYSYNSTDDSLTPYNVIARRPFTDATIFCEDNKAYLLTTQRPNQNGNVLDIYGFDTERFTISKEPIQTVSFDNKRARNAGEIFKSRGKAYRPAQDCNGGYGKGVILQELKITDGEFVFKDYCSFYPNSWVYHMGYHTFNSYKGLTVLDAHGYRFVLLGRFLEALSSIARKFL